MNHLATSATPAESFRGCTAWMAAQPPQEPLLAAGTVVHFAENREVFAEGDETVTFFKVVSGVVRTCKFLGDGRRQIEAFYVEGDVFGFDAGTERRVSAETVSECTLISYRRRNVDNLARNDVAVGQQLFEMALQSLARAQDHCLLLGRRGAAEKVAAFLLDWAGRSDAQRMVRLAMSRQDIGDYLGLTIETVSRTLSQLERDGIIELPNARQVRLLNTEALEDLAA